jgi:hypothetical protein
LAAEVALVMSVQGKVMRHDGANTVPLEAYAKLNAGDRLSLEKDAQLRVAYFENGRHETWAGPGGLELTARGGEPLGMTAPTVKSLPLAVARQLARTPATDGDGRKAATRTRSVAGARCAGAAGSHLPGTARQVPAPTIWSRKPTCCRRLFELRELESRGKAAGAN